MAVHREHCLVGIRDTSQQLANGMAILFRNGIAHGVRDIDGGGTGVDHRLDNTAEKIQLGTAGILAGKFHITHVIAGMLHRRHCMLDHLIRL